MARSEEKTAHEALALQFRLAHDAAPVVIPGAKSPEQIRRRVQAFDSQRTPEELAQAQGVREATTAEKIRVGIVGTGRVGVDWHLPDIREAGGGAGMDSCPHRRDLVLYLLDNPRVVSVVARTYNHFVNRPIPATAPNGYKLMDVAEGMAPSRAVTDIEDTVIALIQFATGGTLFLRDMQSAHLLRIEAPPGP